VRRTSPRRSARPAPRQDGRAADGWFRDGVAAGLLAWPLSELPSLADHVCAGRPWWSTDAAAATLVAPASLPVGQRRVLGTALRVLVAANWGAVLSRWLDRRHPVAHGAVAGAVLAGFEYGLVGRRRPAIEALPALPQVADQVVFGTVVGALLRRSRAGRAGRPR
jgi:hypothetical protein